MRQKKSVNIANHPVLDEPGGWRVADFIVGHGCGEAQGYHVARPMPAAGIPGCIKTGQWRRDPARPKSDPADAQGLDRARDRRS